MTKTEFAGFIREHGPVILDGATGTNLMEAGMPIGVCPESWVLENPQVLLELQRRYVEAGSHIVYASTFTGNRIKLEEYGLQERLEEINTQLVALSRQAVGDQALVAGDMTMTGQQLFPMGELLFEELVEVYKEQASVLAKAGVDLFVVETMMSLQECRAAVIAIREVCDLPIMVTLTYNEDGRTLFGTPPETAVVVLQSLGRGCDRCKLFYRSDGDGTSGGKDGRICYDSAHRKAKRRTPGTRGKENGVPHDTGRICRGRCGTGKSGSSHCRWMLRYNGKAYQGTFGCNAGDGTSQATCIASQDSCV